MAHTQSTGTALQRETSIASTVVTMVVDSDSELDVEDVEVVEVPGVDEEELLSKCSDVMIEKRAHNVV